MNVSAEHISFVNFKLENVKVLIFSYVTPLYSSGGHSNMAAVGFNFPTIDARSSPIFEISEPEPMDPCGWTKRSQVLGTKFGIFTTRLSYTVS